MKKFKQSNNLIQSVLTKINNGELELISRGEYTVFLFRICRTRNGNMSTSGLQKLGVSLEQARSFFALNETFEKVGVNKDCDPMVLAAFSLNNYFNIITKPFDYDLEARQRYTTQKFEELLGITFNQANS